MLADDLIDALKGRSIWIRIKKKYRVKDGVLVLLITDGDEKVNDFAWKHLENYRKKKYMSKVIILTDQGMVRALWKKNPMKQTKIVCLKSRQGKVLLKYYQLQRFYSDFLVVSLSQPAGNTVGNMLQSGKMTEEELILGSIYA